MKIAQIASPWIAIPPKNYGGTENVLYTLVEEQVAQGHKVTLFAPGDAKTSAKLVSFLPKSLLAAGESWQAHLKAYYHFHCTVEYLKEHDLDMPVIVSGTLYKNGRTLFGQTPEAFYISVSHFDALAVGFNCGVGVDLLRPAMGGFVGPWFTAAGRGRWRGIPSTPDPGWHASWRRC